MSAPRRRPPAPAALLLVLLAPAARAEPTLELYIRDAKEVFEGDPVSTTVDAEGRVGLGLDIAVLTEGPGRPAVSLAESPRGLLVGTAGAGLLRVRRGAKPEVIEGAQGLVVSAVAADEDGAWFATGPDGRVARWDGRDVEPWLDPEPAYVWSLLPDDRAVLAATGSPGRLLRVRRGRAEVLFEGEESHLRALIRHPERGLIVGGGEKGVVYQVDPAGEVRALYDSELEEVTALAVDPITGDLFCAIVSGSKEGALDPGTWIGRVAGEKEDDTSPIKGSEVVRIRRSGDVDRLWSSKDEGALGLAVDPDRRRLHVVTGTGPKKRARVYAVELDRRLRVVLLARLEPALATAVVPTGNGGLLVATAPDGAIYRLGPRIRAEGIYLSVEQDLRRVARVGRIWFDAEIPRGTRVEVSLRTGNTETPDRTWSAWSAPVAEPDGGAIDVPRGRYAQFRARLVGTEGRDGPVLRSMHASVRRANLAPSVVEVFPLRPGVYLKPIPGENETEKTVSLSASILRRLAAPEPRDEDRFRVRAGIDPGMQTVAWRASDPNGDDLLYTARLEPEEGDPVELGDDLEVPFVTFDGRAYPDGRYRLRVEATDRASNAPDEALVDELASPFFVLDNTPPEVDSLVIRRIGGRRTLRASATDASSRLGRAEVSVNGGPWLLFPPADGLVDASAETFQLDLEPLLPERGSSVLRVRVEDETGNRVARTIRSGG